MSCRLGVIGGQRDYTPGGPGRPRRQAAGESGADRTELARVLGFGAITIYGIGDILGAGIYALVGTVAAVAGTASWISFAAAMGIASLTALSYAELGGRFPRSAGEAYFCRVAFGREGPALFVGWLVLSSGIVSTATVAWAFSGYLAALLPGVPVGPVVLAFLVSLAALSYRGMRASSVTNIALTAVEASGLLVVVVAGLLWLGGAEAAAPSAPVETGEVPWRSVVKGAALAFFAFIGFEDMVNVAEEVRRPERTMPAAILTALAVTGTMYVVVSWIAVRVVGAGPLAASSAPLLEVVRSGAPGVPEWGFILVALFAVSNTALLNFIMASRLLYGMSRQGLLPRWIGAVHASHRTPHRAIGIVFLLAATLALSGTLVRLAGTTSFLVLAVFVTVNSSLIVIRRRSGIGEGFRVPLVVPVLGVSGSLVLMGFVPAGSLPAALGIGALGIALILAGGTALRRR
jgi:amino acid transporter